MSKKKIICVVIVISISCVLLYHIMCELAIMWRKDIILATDITEAEQIYIDIRKFVWIYFTLKHPSMVNIDNDINIKFTNLNTGEIYYLPVYEKYADRWSFSTMSSDLDFYDSLGKEKGSIQYIEPGLYSVTLLLDVSPEQLYQFKNVSFNVTLFSRLNKGNKISRSGWKLVIPSSSNIDLITFDKKD